MKWARDFQGCAGCLGFYTNLVAVTLNSKENTYLALYCASIPPSPRPVGARCGKTGML